MGKEGVTWRNLVRVDAPESNAPTDKCTLFHGEVMWEQGNVRLCMLYEAWSRELSLNVDYSSLCFLRFASLIYVGTSGKVVRLYRCATAANRYLDHREIPHASQLGIPRWYASLRINEIFTLIRHFTACRSPRPDPRQTAVISTITISRPCIAQYHHYHSTTTTKQVSYNCQRERC